MTDHWCKYCNGMNTHNCQFNNLPRTKIYSGWAQPTATSETVNVIGMPEVERLADALRELERELRREAERQWEGNRRAVQEYLEDMRDVLKEAAQICKDLDDEALAKEGRLACGAECAAAIADLAVRWNVPFHSV